MSRYIDFDGDSDVLDEGLDDSVNLDFDPSVLSNNTLTLIALANEYCASCENAGTAEPSKFISNMIRLLPRIYITAGDIKTGILDDGSGYISPSLDEDSYNRVRDQIASLLGEDDTFLEVFEQDMIYSDTPIAATISESLADLFQVFYDFIETVRDAPNDLIIEAIGSLRESFAQFWSQTLTNVLRPLNALKYQKNV